MTTWNWPVLSVTCVALAVGTLGAVGAAAVVMWLTVQRRSGTPVVG